MVRVLVEDGEVISGMSATATVIQILRKVCFQVMLERFVFFTFWWCQFVSLSAVQMPESASRLDSSLTTVP